MMTEKAGRLNALVRLFGANNGNDIFVASRK